MHRSGSSLTANVLHDLGMSLGPFPRVGGDEFNRHGYFEAQPICDLNREVQELVQGFPDDLPASAEDLRRFRARRGAWQRDLAAVPEEFSVRAKTLLEELIQSGPVSGFKDPRVPLLWPFWLRVLSQFTGLRTVLLMLLRSPHEIAMSVFARGRGNYAYRDALDVAAIHLRQMSDIWDSWRQDRAVVRFDGATMADDLRRAAQQCGLGWRDEVLANVYDGSCKHQRPAVVQHEAQALFERLAQLPPSPRGPEDMLRIEQDTLTREEILRRQLAKCQSESDQFRTMAEVNWRDLQQLREHAQSLEHAKQQAELAVQQCRQENTGLQQELARSQRQNDQYRQEVERYRQTGAQSRDRLRGLQSELTLIKGSRTWRLRQQIVSVLHRRRGADLNGGSHRTDPPESPARRRRLVSPADAARRCTIIVPVYNAFPEALDCIRSVLASTSGAFQVLVIDDCSTQGQFADCLPAEIRLDPHLRFIRNARNLGFVKSCNLGMQQSRPNDVVLLNSDTLVTPGWLVKLQQAAACNEMVGTVTPLTNNGSICSVPRFLKDNEIPSNHTLHEFAALVEKVSVREYPELPTCVGYCVYVKREALDKVGPFNEKAFGKGYGEENEFSCRLQAAGYLDLLDDATFIYHRGRTSFQDQAERLTAEHLVALERMHPGYCNKVHQFIATNPLRAVQERVHHAMFQHWNQAAEYRVLHVLHKRPLTEPGRPLPGGTEYHVADLIRHIPAAGHWSLFAADGGYCLVAHVPGHEREFHFSAAEMDLDSILDPHWFDVVHLHHASTYDYPALAQALARHGRYFISLHDFRCCCPRVNLLTPDSRLCNGRECAAACRQKQAEVDALRSTTRRLFSGALGVFHFSTSTRSRFMEILGDGRHYPWKLIEHGTDLPVGTGHAAWAGTETRESLPCSDVAANGLQRPSPGTPLKVMFVGAISICKGADLVRKIVKRRALTGGIPLEWHLVGIIDGALDPAVIQHGRYERADLPEIIKTISPHLAALVSLWPETYCYTLEEALSCGIPVIATPLGGPAERIRRYRCGWLSESLSADDFLAALQRIVDHWDEYDEACRRIAAIALPSAGQAAKQYHELYRGALAGKSSADPVERPWFLDDPHGKPHGAHLPASAYGRVLGSLVQAQASAARSLAARVTRRLLPATWFAALWRRPHSTS
jgi:GT2 family glycosyltransferase